jgi:hypothetical protein
MGEFYQLLAERLPEERLFWEGAVSDEINHARRIGRLIAMLSSNQQAYRAGKYRVAVLATFLMGVYENIDHGHKNTLTTPQLLQIAYDYEHAAIIARPYEAVESTDIHFHEFRQAFTRELQEHTDRVLQYIAIKLNIHTNTAKIRIVGPPKPAGAI